jgi:hypothetical protein
VKITFEQIGGFPGYLAWEAETEELSPDEAAQLQSLIDQVIREASDAPSTVARPAAWGPEYVFTVVSDEGTHRVSFNDQSRPDEAADLEEFLQSHGRPCPPRPAASS